VCTRSKKTKIISLNRYIRFVEISSGLIKESRIPLYSSKFSKKTYNQHQLLILILLKEYLSDDYRDTVDLVDLMNEIKQRINLDSMPHFTTLHKFSQKISLFTFTRFLNRLIKMFYDWEERIPCTAIDSSGSTSSYASYYDHRVPGSRAAHPENKTTIILFNLVTSSRIPGSTARGLHLIFCLLDMAAVHDSMTIRALLGEDFIE
jgi:hypothetical protein